MPLIAGSRLGPYEITALIGVGGMGEVYRARDTRLDRTVAVKVVSSLIGSSADLRERFEREARTISQLAHPHICTLFDVGRAKVDGMDDAVEFLVLEHLEGQTLADRLVRGPLPLEEALSTARQICAALDAAHRSGVVHRDLKPGNVMLTPTGAKLLDFGLAKGAAPNTAAAGGRTHLAPSMTMSAPLTAKGTILGTFQYMAPEQVEGSEADSRSDIWAFGCVLYEMLTGRRVFEGKSQASLIASILEREPTPVSQVQPLSPPVLDGIIRTCLAKDPEARFQSAHDLNLALQLMLLSGSSTTAAVPPGRKRRAMTMAGWAVAAVATIAVLAVRRAPSPAPPPTVAFDVTVSQGEQLRTASHAPLLAISADGLRLAYVAGNGQTNQLYLRDLGHAQARPVEGISGDVKSPFFSPDGRWVGIFHAGALKKVPLDGGSPVTVCAAPSGHGGAWSTNGTIVFTP